ncbi:MAG TPA: hypothetical protein VFQ25_02815 [Ktedonobacterales bacterium]|nr:hypothetical protein [Ktedonobacterales bacterium]
MIRREGDQIERLKRDAEAARTEAEAAYQQWRQLADQVRQQRIDAINWG